QFLGARLPGRLADKAQFEALPAEAKEFILRMLVLMKRASFPATEFNSHMVKLLFVVNPAMLPSAWGGEIPPLTSPGRHRKLDAYVTQQTWHLNSGPPVFIDLGCGFPPVTTADTAKSMPDWSVIGVDRTFARYLLYDAKGNYACFNRKGKFKYLQMFKKFLHDNPKKTQDRFEFLFARLQPSIKIFDDHHSETVEKDGNRLVYNHVRDFEAQNLKFVESDIEALQSPTARVIRCMNLLLYFEKRVRQRMRQSIGDLLDDGGLLISGFNHPLGIYARYTVDKKDSTGLKPCEFAFSPDNLRPLGIGPWVTIKGEDENAELLADLTGTIRADLRFWADFNQYVDVLRAEYGICRRDNDGFIYFTDEMRTAPPNIIMQKTTALWNQLEAEGYTDGAVEALVRAGYQAWKNPVGDISVVPPDFSQPTR
ncbi:hypothetical protein ACFL5W_01875, partial [Thermodesulfobacteriota bacterium]